LASEAILSFLVQQKGENGGSFRIGLGLTIPQSLLLPSAAFC
jgi:hypothetical protein